MIWKAGFSLATCGRIHFIGIGGIGMSGIARLLRLEGFPVSGTDERASEITRRLEAEGCRVGIGHRAAAVRGAGVAVISSAVKEDNPEVREARRLGIPVAQRAQMLAELAALKKTITFSGSHGKTTTSSMAAAAFEAAGADPTAVVGGILRSVSSNVRHGGGEYLVMESDESDGSFLHYSPLVACVTNIDSDHLDFYRDMDRLKDAFVEHLARVPFYGAAVLCGDDPGVRSIMPRVACPSLTYGFGAGCDWRAADMRTGPSGTSYTAYFKGHRRGPVRLRTGGSHNVLNSLCVIAAGSYLGLPFDGLARGLAGFGGVKRRLEPHGEAGGVKFMDDYGHHPTEIRNTLAAIRAIHRPRRLIALFQPHRYSRTSLLYREFARELRAADKVCLMDIYPAGEKPLKGVTSGLILGAAGRGSNISPYPGVLEVAKDLRPGDLLLSLGAGDVWKTLEEVKSKFELIGG